ncbi:hypothetical protein HMPREF2829_00120 [Aerococcus sp. HMSC072A12]|uniref:DUF3744 domain-containing protein n=1 Tax=Aerococcus sp. HMSC072A12 TaxID=1739333 RepID=UPI0008A513C1|nr:ABC transporter ATP-binding protein [Aerococcus sp. HMSC072A12]OFK22075.1 hypothetical protein HMPREF2829_00120 [Aerococcus sp. HMSC072A12]
MGEAWIKFNNFSFTYAGAQFPALKDINLTIEKGEKVLVLGANGSGKTSFLKALNQELGTAANPGKIEGSVSYCDHNVESFKGKDIADFISEEADDEHLVDLTPQDEGNFSKRIWALLAKDSQGRSYNDLSAGEQDLYRMLDHIKDHKKLYIFDEPLANLAPRAAEGFVDALDDFHMKTQSTIVVVEHRLEQMMYRHIDRVLVLLGGRLVFDGSLSDLLHHAILANLDVREPLYVTAMRYAGYPLDQVHHIAHVNHISGPNLKKVMEDWALSIPNFRYQESKEELIRLEGVSYHYNHKNHALKDLNLKICQGEMISVVGANGAGKTTLSRILSQSLQADQGQIYWHGQAVSEDNRQAVRNKIAYLLQDFKHLILGQNPWEQLDRTYAHYQEAGCQLAENKEDLFNQVLAAIGFDHLKSYPLKFLSYGQLKRLILASVLLKEPDLIIIDEPTEGQDYRHMVDFMGTLYQINQEQGIAVIMNTYDVEVLLAYTRRCLVMAEGEIIADTDPVHVTSNEDLVDQAALRESSLSVFAKRIGLVDPYAFIRKFMDYDREVQQS